MRICIDPGHGGNDSGAIADNPFPYQEKEFNLTFSLVLEKSLRELGHSVVMVRRSDHSVSLEARASFANRLNADLFVSIHANAAKNPGIEGMEVFHFPGSDEGHLVADYVLGNMIAVFPDHRNRGVKEANFTVLRLTLMPAILIECEFLTNPTQLLFLIDSQNQTRLANAIAIGLNEYIFI